MTVWGCPEHNPSIYGAAKVVGKIVPKLNGKFIGRALCPNPQCVGYGSDLPFGESSKYDDIKKVIKQVSEGPLR